MFKIGEPVRVEREFEQEGTVYPVVFVVRMPDDALIEEMRTAPDDAKLRDLWPPEKVAAWVLEVEGVELEGKPFVSSAETWEAIHSACMPLYYTAVEAVSAAIPRVREQDAKNFKSLSAGITETDQNTVSTVN